MPPLKADSRNCRGGTVLGRRERTPVESIVVGVIFTAVFGGLLLFKGPWFWAFPMLAAGIFPVVEGVRRLLGRKKEVQNSSQQREAETERQILRAARDSGGRLTATEVALQTKLTIKEAQGALEKLSREGHAVMNVTDNGIVEFEFPELVARLPGGSSR